MSYTTDTKVRYYINASGSLGVGTDVIGTLAVSYSIQNADNLIDLKLSKRFDVPFSTTPPVIETLSTKLSSWECLRSLYTGEIPSSIAQVKEEYDRTMKLLDDIQSGILDLPIGTSGGGVVSDKSSDSKYWSSNMNYTPTFDVDDELNWRTDTDRLSDIAGKRA
jgi:phage gp36-like protein